MITCKEIDEYLAYAAAHRTWINTERRQLFRNVVKPTLKRKDVFFDEDTFRKCIRYCESNYYPLFLYEKFILEYYRREHPELNAGAPYIAWALDDGFDDMLPAMHTDITLTQGCNVLIIDAKYYSHTTQQQFDKRSVHSGNLYQIFTYVKNKEAELVKAGVPHEVSGMLLYARTDENVQPDGVYQMSGNQMSVRTLGLDLPFEEIRAQLDGIADTHFQRT